MLVYVDGAMEGYMEFGSWYAPVEAEGTVEVEIFTDPFVTEQELPDGVVEWQGDAIGEGKLTRQMAVDETGVFNATVTLGDPWPIDLTVFEVTGLEVEGAEAGQPEGTYYTILGGPQEYVTITAEITPEMDEWDFPGWDLLQWTGGDWGMGMDDRIVPKWQSGVTDVRLQCGEFDEEVTIVVVAIDRIQYRLDAGDPWADVPETLYVPLGTEVVFKAIPDPTGAWPDGYPEWGGAALTDPVTTTETTSVIFDQTGPFTVSAECGNTVSANIITVGIEKIQYKIGGGEFKDAPIAGQAVLFVPVGTEVVFKAIPNPAGAEWPDGFPVWGGVAEGIGETTSVLFEELLSYIVRVECGNTVQVNITAFDLSLKNVCFDGDKYHPITSDDGNQVYNHPHWRDDSNPPDGTAVTAYPVAFTRNTKPRVAATWQLSSGVNAAFKIRGTGPNGIEFPETTGIIYGYQLSIGFVESQTAFANAIGYYGNFEINWEFSIDDGDNWHDGGKSSNQVYVTLGDPIQGTTVFHTLIHIGCTNAAGDTDADTAVDSIYSEFTNRNVKRVSDNVQMKYWDNPQDIPISTSEMLAHHNGDGNCQAWSALLRDCFRVQGINSDRIWVRPIYPLVDRAVLVKDWEFDNNPSAGGNHPYYVYAEARPIPGIPAQGNDDPPYAFNAHWITRYNNTYYDPSYGTPKVTGQDRDILYENASFDGYGNLGVTRARKNDPVLNEVTYVVDN